MKIKILHIIKSLGRGGAEMLLPETLKSHNKEQFEFHYLYFLPWKNQMVEGIEKAGGKVVNMTATNNIKLMLQANKVIKYIKENNINLIHCHLPWAGFLGRWIHWRTGVTVLYTEHNKQERYHFITRFLNKFSFNSQSKAIAVSEDVAASIKKNINPSIPVTTILNGVDTDRFVRERQLGIELRKKYNIPEDAILLGNIAVFRFQKRLKEWIDLFKLVHDKNPNIYGCIIGDGPLNEEIRSHLKAQGLEDKIIMPGLQTNVMPWLSAIDIFLMTSQFEGLPIALLEAMSMGCAVVSTDAGGIVEVIRNNEDGFLLPVDQWNELEHPLNKLLQNHASIQQWGEKARNRVVNSFSMKTMVKELEAEYLLVD